MAYLCFDINCDNSPLNLRFRHLNIAKESFEIFQKISCFDTNKYPSVMLLFNCRIQFSCCSKLCVKRLNLSEVCDDYLVNTLLPLNQRINLLIGF